MVLAVWWWLGGGVAGWRLRELAVLWCGIVAPRQCSSVVVAMSVAVAVWRCGGVGVWLRPGLGLELGLGFRLGFGLRLGLGSGLI